MPPDTVFPLAYFQAIPLGFPTPMSESETSMTSVALAVQHDERQDIVDFMSDFSLETTPNSAAKIASFSECVRPQTPVYITFLPGSDFDATIALATRLRREVAPSRPQSASSAIRCSCWRRGSSIVTESR